MPILRRYRLIEFNDKRIAAFHWIFGISPCDATFFTNTRFLRAIAADLIRRQIVSKIETVCDRKRGKNGKEAAARVVASCFWT